MFIIEDDNNNKFGGYYSKTITNNNGDNQRMTDSNAFSFSLKLNENNNGMKKFGISNADYAFRLFKKSESILFQFDYEPMLSVYKKGIYFKL